MFQCAVCKQPIGPKVKPNRVVTGTRNTEYHNEYFVEDEWGNKEKRKVDSTGSEITGEQLVCGPCIGAPVENAPSTTIVRGKDFQEKPAEAMRVRLIAAVAHTALDRVEHASKRAVRDNTVAIPTIKWFVDHNKGFVF